MMDSPRVGIVISTKNRKDSLRRTLSECARQTYRPLDTVVFDDGSTDGTAEMVRSEFPSVRVERVEGSKGYIHHRNRAADVMADCRYLISLDDDSWFLNEDAIGKAVELYGTYPNTVLLSFEIFAPFHPPLAPDPARDGMEISLFIGCGYMVDRERFIRLGRFPEWFEFYGEETDLAMRIVNSPWKARFVSSAAVYHAISSAERNQPRITQYSLANALSIYCLREPWIVCPLHCAAAIGRAGINAIRRRSFSPVFSGLGMWWKRRQIVRAERRPISLHSLLAYRRMQKRWHRYFRAREQSSEPRQKDFGRG